MTTSSVTTEQQQAELTKLIQTIDAEIKKITDITNYHYTEFQFGSDKVDGLTQLKKLLSEKAEGRDVNFDAEITTTFKSSHSVFPTHQKTHSILNFAVMFCQAELVDYLLNNGAKANNSTIHHAIRGYNNDMNRVVGVLQNHGVDLNSLNKKNQTAMYKYTRKRENGAKAVACLKDHGAHMLFGEKIKAPVLNFIDKKKTELFDLELMFTTGGFRSC